MFERLKNLSFLRLFSLIFSLAIFISGGLIYSAFLAGNPPESTQAANQELLSSIITNEKYDRQAAAQTVTALFDAMEEAYATKEALMLVGFAALTLILTGLVGLVFSRRLSHTLDFISKSALRVANGSFTLQETASSQLNSLGTSKEVRTLFHAFETMTKAIKRMERESSDSAAAIAHELNTPLTILRGRLQGLEDGTFKANSELLQALIEQVDLLSAIATDLSTLSRFKSGQQVLNLNNSLDLASLAKSVINNFAPDFKAENMHIETDLQFAPVNADPMRIMQALTALINNVMGYAAQGGYIKIETKLENGWAYILVTDRGPGIASADRERIFDRWWRADLSRSRKAGGSGLGLSVVKAIADAHGGSIKASDGDEGIGTKFSLSLPAYIRPEAL